jgi:carbamoyltransferase
MIATQSNEGKGSFRLREVVVARRFFLAADKPPKTTMSRKPTIVMGINSAHDASVCILIDGQLRIAIPEERLARKKHYQGYPYLAVTYCLEVAGLADIHAVDCIVINEYEQTDFALMLREENYQGLLICNPSHHLLHAYYAWIASGFDAPAILILDGSGYSYGEYHRRGSPALGDAPPFNEMEEAESLYLVRDGNIQVVEKRWGLWEASRPYFRFPSLGHMYSMASQYIFGDWIHAGKTMGLAPYGDAAALPWQIISYTESGIEIDTKWIARMPPRSSELAHLDKTCCDLAAKVQDELEKAMLYLADRLYRQTRSKSLCISGGVGLNSVANGRILRESSFDNLFVTPAANDTGIAIGAALYGHQQLRQSVPQWNYAHDFHGRSYSEAEILAALKDNPMVKYEKLEDIARHAARDIVNGAIIGWYEGGSEFGPRALGHRSILCDARDKDMKDRLNRTVKFRETFRPYAASVLSEYTREFFDLEVESPYMLIVTQVRCEKRDLIPSVCHVDNTCRVQMVPPGFEGNYRKLLEYFMQMTGVPIVLDTSFNIRGEPIVETPNHALRCFLGSNMDALYLHDYRVTKIVIDNLDNFEFLKPFLNSDLSMGISMDVQNGDWTSEMRYITARTGHKSQIKQIEFEILRLVNGERSIGEINKLLIEKLTDQELKLLFTGLQQQGFISFRTR